MGVTENIVVRKDYVAGCLGLSETSTLVERWWELWMGSDGRDGEASFSSSKIAFPRSDALLLREYLSSSFSEKTSNVERFQGVLTNAIQNNFDVEAEDETKMLRQLRDTRTAWTAILCGVQARLCRVQQETNSVLYEEGYLSVDDNLENLIFEQTEIQKEENGKEVEVEFPARFSKLVDMDVSNTIYAIQKDSEKIINLEENLRMVGDPYLMGIMDDMQGAGSVVRCLSLLGSMARLSKLRGDELTAALKLLNCIITDDRTAWDRSRPSVELEMRCYFLIDPRGLLANSWSLQRVFPRVIVPPCLQLSYWATATAAIQRRIQDLSFKEADIDDGRNAVTLFSLYTGRRGCIRARDSSFAERFAERLAARPAFEVFSMEEIRVFPIPDSEDVALLEFKFSTTAVLASRSADSFGELESAITEAMTSYFLETQYLYHPSGSSDGGEVERVANLQMKQLCLVVGFSEGSLRMHMAMPAFVAGRFLNTAFGNVWGIGLGLSLAATTAIYGANRSLSGMIPNGLPLFDAASSFLRRTAISVLSIGSGKDSAQEAVDSVLRQARMSRIQQEPSWWSDSSKDTGHFPLLQNVSGDANAHQDSPPINAPSNQQILHQWEEYESNQRRSWEADIEALAACQESVRDAIAETLAELKNIQNQEKQTVKDHLEFLFCTEMLSPKIVDSIVEEMKERGMTFFHSSRPFRSYHMCLEQGKVKLERIRICLAELYPRLDANKQLYANVGKKLKRNFFLFARIRDLGELVRPFCDSAYNAKTILNIRRSPSPGLSDRVTQALAVYGAIRLAQSAAPALKKLGIAVAAAAV
eukprot:scaffold8760_cov155-Amphora_coffeaeformis.AAC.3